MTFNQEKPCRTRDGRKARIICTERQHETHPIVALVGDQEIPGTYMRDGSGYSHREHLCDLINIPEKHVRWIVAHPNIGYTSEEAALERLGQLRDGRLGQLGDGPSGRHVLRIEWEDK